MKPSASKFFFILFLTVGLHTGIYAQVEDSLKYRAIYKLTFQPDSASIDSKKTETMWLLMGDQSSEFLSKPLAIKDSLPKLDYQNLNSEKLKARREKTKTDFDFKVFKDRAEQKIYYGLEIVQDKLYYSQPFRVMQWQIQTKTKQISGYTAQKASTSFAGRDYVAWFTSEIPISDGPYKFSGLPGLILEIADSQQEYVFTFEGFEELSQNPALSIPPKDYQQSSKKELLALKQRYEDDPISYVNNSTNGKITIGLKGKKKEEFLRKRRAKMAKENNPIELE